MKIPRDIISLAILLAVVAITGNAQRPRLDRGTPVEAQPRAEPTPLPQPNNEALPKDPLMANAQQAGANYLVKFDGQGNPNGTSIMRDNDGYIGIGTPTPQSLLHISGLFSDRPRANLGSSSGSTRSGRVEQVNQAGTYIPPFAGLIIDQHYTAARSTNGFTFLVRSIDSSGTAGLGGRGGSGTRTDFMITGGGKVGLGTDKPNAQLHIENAGGPANIRLAGSEITDNYDGVLHIRSGGDRVEFDGQDTVVVDVLQIKGGADFSENFDVSIAGDRSIESPPVVEPGMVVSIDPANPGKLVVSTTAYDSRVAGIISGAGGVKPGMTMGQLNTMANGSRSVALSGRVYCFADASYGPIEPGDLLTTSDTPGFAQKVTDREKAQGAIIGKAMTRLSSGKGLLLVLVSLQ